MMKKLFLNEKYFKIVKTTIAFVIAMAITFVTLCMTTDMPVNAFAIMLTAPVTQIRYLGNVLEIMVPLLFTSLACAILFRTGIFNLGVEGIFFITGIVTTAFATQITINNSVLHPLVVILASSVTGGLLMLIPGFLLAKFKTNILVITLMLNSIYLGIGLWILKKYLLAKDISTTASSLFHETAKLPYIFKGTRLTAGIIIALITAVLFYLLMNRTKLGYQIRITGLNSNFAKYSGIAAFSLILLVHFISGFLAGMGSSIELLSLYDRFTWSKITTHASTGMMIAMMGNNQAAPVVAAAFAISYLEVGASIMSRSTSVPTEIIAIVQATLVLLISSRYFLGKTREKLLLKEGKANV